MGADSKASKLKEGIMTLGKDFEAQGISQGLRGLALRTK